MITKYIINIYFNDFKCTLGGGDQVCDSLSIIRSIGFCSSISANYLFINDKCKPSISSLWISHNNVRESPFSSNLNDYSSISHASCFRSAFTRVVKWSDHNIFKLQNQLDLEISDLRTFCEKCRFSEKIKSLYYFRFWQVVCS